MSITVIVGIVAGIVLALVVACVILAAMFPPKEYKGEPSAGGEPCSACASDDKESSK